MYSCSITKRPITEPVSTGLNFVPTYLYKRKIPSKHFRSINVIEYYNVWIFCHLGMNYVVYHRDPGFIKMIIGCLRFHVWNDPEIKCNRQYVSCEATVCFEFVLILSSGHFASPIQFSTTSF